MPSTRKKQIAQLVKDARARKGLTQAELAEAVDVNPQTIGHIERALHMPREGLLEKLEDALDTDLSAEAQVGHAMIDEVVRRMTDRMEELGPSAGITLAADVLDYVETWHPRRSDGG